MPDLALLLAAPGPAFGKKAVVERTGQTECWDPADTVYPIDKIDCADTGQDGDLQSGVRWPKPRFKDLCNGWVLDRLTGLEWLEDAN
ncbi:MAG: hypothetical protein GY850_32820 [bacterium]|nr:hypothetical protein [bacterium]